MFLTKFFHLELPPPFYFYKNHKHHKNYIIQLRIMEIILICYVFFLFGNCKSATIDDVIESCLLKILNNHFFGQPVLLITDLTLNSSSFRRSLLPNLSREYHRQIIGKIMNKIKWTLQIYNSDKYIGLPPRLKLNKVKNCFFFIRAEILSSKVLFDWEMDRLHKNPLWNPSGRTLIVVRGQKDVKSEYLARIVIEKLWTKSKSVNNVVMVAEEGGSVHFFTWFPYRLPDCSKVNTIVRLNTFHNGKFKRGKIDLFPPKIDDDLQGCEIIAATESCIPYVFADEHNASSFVGGLEISIVNSLSEVLNFTLTTVRPVDMWTTSVNNSLVGAFKMLVDQKVDLAFSCLMLNRERYLLALALPPYYSDSLVWFVPSPTFKSHVTDIFHAFVPLLWLIMICIMFLSTFLVMAFSYQEGRSVLGSIVKIIGLFIYAPVFFPAKKTTFRLFIFVLFLYTMHVTIAFQSSLFALYQKPQYKQYYSSLRQAVSEGLFVYLRSSTKELYNQSDHDLWEEILKPNRFDYLKDFGEVFSEIAYDKTAIALFIRTTGIYMISTYFTDDFGIPQILWLRDKFAPYPVSAYMSPGHPLFPVFEKAIYNLLASGLMKIWLRRAILGGKLTWDRRSYANSPLTLKHVGGAFFLLLLLLFVALLTFTSEILLYRVLRRIKERKKPQHRHFPPVKSKFLNSNSVTIIRVE